VNEVFNTENDLSAERFDSGINKSRLIRRAIFPHLDKCPKSFYQK
jgi:hypothetical protein